MVGRGGIAACELKSSSSDLGLSMSISNARLQLSEATYSSLPLPQILKTATSDGPVQATIKPDSVIITSDSRDRSTLGFNLVAPISFNAGNENARIEPSPNTPTKA